MLCDPLVMSDDPKYDGHMLVSTKFLYEQFFQLFLASTFFVVKHCTESTTATIITTATDHYCTN